MPLAQKAPMERSARRAPRVRQAPRARERLVPRSRRARRSRTVTTLRTVMTSRTVTTSRMPYVPARRAMRSRRAIQRRPARTHPSPLPAVPRRGSTKRPAPRLAVRLAPRLASRPLRPRGEHRGRPARRGDGAPCAPRLAPAPGRAPRSSSWRATSRRASSPPRRWLRRRRCHAGDSWRLALPSPSGHANASRVPSGLSRARSDHPSVASGGCALRHPSREAWTTLRRSRCRIRPPGHSPEASSNCLPRAATRPRSRALRECLSPTARRRCRSPPSPPARTRRPDRPPQTRPPA